MMLKEPLLSLFLKNLKTETRRIVRVPKKATQPNYGFSHISNEDNFVMGLVIGDGVERCEVKPNYKKGSTFFIKEPYLKDGDGFMYKYDLDEDDPDRKKLKWKNKMFMPESSCRHYGEIEDVKLEHLRRISVQSIIAEGIERKGREDYELLGEWIRLWNSINKVKGIDWVSNPFVWVYKIKSI